MIKWTIDDEGNELTETTSGKFVYKQNFEKRFGDADIYDDLINHENLTDGWKFIFDKWKERGILK